MNAIALATIGDNSASYGEMIAEDPNIVFRDETVLPGLIAEIEKGIAEREVNLSTDSGRKAIASHAAQIAKKKTAIDAAGKTRNEDLRAKINVVDAVRREVREKLDALRDTARAPLTEWEEKEDARKEALAGVIALLDSFGRSPDLTLEEVEQQEASVTATVISEEDYGGFYPRAIEARDGAISAIAAARARIEKAEADRIELEKLRAIQAAREAEEAARVEKERQEAEAQRIRGEAAREAQRAAQAAIEKAEAEKRAAIEKAEADAAAAARAIEQQKQEFEAQKAREQAARDAEAKRIADEAAAAAAEEARRARNRKLIAEARGAAKDAILKASGITDEQAVKIVLAIHKGEVPGVTLAI
jgi:hypothetical protein